GLTDNTIVVYTSDQGVFLGDDGWYDRRFMYEEPLRMPFIVRYPEAVRAGTTTDDFALIVDLAETVLDYAVIYIPECMQCNSLRAVLEERTPAHWQTSYDYRYLVHLSELHKVVAHYGMRMHSNKLIYYYGEALGSSNTLDESREPEWILFDL